MLALVAQPNQFCPNPKSRPIQWVIQTDEHITSAGSPAFFVVEVVTTGGANGQILVLAGQTFTTNNSQAYTFNTFNQTGTSEAVADNLANAIRANQYFQDFQVWISNPGGLVWQVNVFNFDNQQYQDWTFDSAGLGAMVVTLSDTNGQGPTIKNARLWYRIYNANLPITKERYRNLPFDPSFPFFTEVKVPANEVTRAIVKSTMPGLTITDDPIEDFDWSTELQIRFGIYELDADCNPVYGEGQSSDDALVCNAVFQYEHTRSMFDHCPNLISGVKFLTDRPTEMTLCSGTNEWLHIWIENTALWVGDFKAVYSFYSGTNAIGESEKTLPDDNQAFIIPAGWAMSFAPMNADRYELKIQGQQLNESDDLVWVDYSETITRRRENCNCKAAEIYFLEDRGSFRTSIFEKVVNRTSQASEVTYELPITFEGAYKTTKYFFEGGIYSEAEMAFNTFRLESKILQTTDDRREFEQMLRSPEIYIKTANQLGEPILRRIIFPKSQLTLSEENAATRVQIDFRFSTNLIVH